MAQTILYYPTINIPNKNWLKNALLYWDNISSIVPYEDYYNLSPHLLYLQSCEIYKPVYPRDLFESIYVNDFKEELITRLNRYTKRHLEHKKNTCTRKIHRDKICAPLLHNLIHYNKISPDLFKYLAENNYIVDYNYDGWIELDSNIAEIYMRTLAEFIIKCYPEDIVIGTDLSKHQDQFYHKTSLKPDTACIELKLDRCLPQPANNVGFEEIIEFKQSHQDDFAVFREKLREFEKNLSACTKIEDIQFETEKFKEAWQFALSKDQKLFTKSKIRFVFGTLHTLIDIADSYEAVNNILQNFYGQTTPLFSKSLLSGIGAISLGYKFVNHKNKINTQRSSSGFSYILKASKENIITSF